MKKIELVVTIKVTDTGKYNDRMVAFESVDNALKTAYDNGFVHPSNEESYAEYTDIHFVE